MNTTRALGCATLLTLFAAACSGPADQAPASETSSASSTATTASANYGTDLQPDAGGKVITVGMMTDEQGNNRFDPANVEAKRGDVIRYTLVSGVHNVNFLPDSNAGKTGLPPAGPMLQLPQQT